MTQTLPNIKYFHRILLLLKMSFPLGSCPEAGRISLHGPANALFLPVPAHRMGLRAPSTARTHLAPPSRALAWDTGDSLVASPDRSSGQWAEASFLQSLCCHVRKHDRDQIALQPLKDLLLQGHVILLHTFYFLCKGANLSLKAAVMPFFLYFALLHHAGD